jgi:molybdopterin synthase sulfur carrier subunit
MELQIALFGITKEIVGQPEVRYSLPPATKVSDLTDRLKADYPRLQDLRSFFVAVNSEYAEEEYELQENDEVALIPPVSGG